ncbi:MAG: hypothetical protein WEB52_02015 [Dehalococcoidia bacterium]
MDSRPRAEQLLTMSSAGRRLVDLIAAAEEPVHYNVMRHLLRVSEETMTEVLQEVVELGLVKRAGHPLLYVPGDEDIGQEMREALGPDRLARHRAQIASAARRVFET